RYGCGTTRRRGVAAEWRDGRWSRRKEEPRRSPGWTRRATFISWRELSCTSGSARSSPPWRYSWTCSPPPAGLGAGPRPPPVAYAERLLPSARERVLMRVGESHIGQTVVRRLGLTRAHGGASPAVASPLAWTEQVVKDYPDRRNRERFRWRRDCCA